MLGLFFSNPIRCEFADRFAGITFFSDNYLVKDLIIYNKLCENQIDCSLFLT
jgi:hypothetical protein